MDVGSELRSQPGRRSRLGEARASARTAGTLLIIVAGLSLLVLLVALSDLLHLAPASEPVLSGPFRWQS